MKLLLSIFTTACCIGANAQSTHVFYKEGLVTELTQLKTNDYIVLQNVNTGYTARNGYVEKNSADMTLKTNQNRFSKPESNEFKNTFSDSQVFKVTVSDNQYKFYNVAGAGYILNNMSSGNATLGSSDENNTFTISTYADDVDKSWSIQSTKNNNVYLHGNDGWTIYYSGPHPYRIIKVSETDNDTQSRNWYTVRHKNTRPAYRMFVDTSNKNFVGMKDIGEGKTGGKMDETYLWTISEDPTTPEACTFVTKNSLLGSVNWIGLNKTDGAQSSTHDNNTRFAYDLSAKHFNLNMIAPDGSPYPYATFKFQTQEESGKYINQAAGGQGYYINYYNANDGTYAFTFSVNAQLNATENGYALGSFIAPFRAKIPQGVEVYTAQESEGNLLLFKQEGTSIPANTAVILKANDAGFYEMLDVSDNLLGENETYTDINVENNVLKGCTYDQEIAPSTGAYVLSSSNNVTAMYNYTGEVIPMYRAYLPKNNSTQQIKKFVFRDSGTTGIDDMTIEQKDNSIYDLSGRKVINPVKGIYIQNGKKFIVK